VKNLSGVIGKIKELVSTQQLLYASRRYDPDAHRLPVSSQKEFCNFLGKRRKKRKPERDALMRELADRHPGYGLEKHKGYGT